MTDNNAEPRPTEQDIEACERRLQKLCEMRDKQRLINNRTGEQMYQERRTDELIEKVRMAISDLVAVVRSPS